MSSENFAMLRARQEGMKRYVTGFPPSKMSESTKQSLKNQITSAKTSAKLNEIEKSMPKYQMGGRRTRRRTRSKRTRRHRK